MYIDFHFHWFYTNYPALTRSVPAWVWQINVSLSHSLGNGTYPVPELGPTPHQARGTEKGFSRKIKQGLLAKYFTYLILSDHNLIVMLLLSPAVRHVVATFLHPLYPHGPQSQSAVATEEQTDWQPRPKTKKKMNARSLLEYIWTTKIKKAPGESS